MMQHSLRWRWWEIALLALLIAVAVTVLIQPRNLSNMAEHAAVDVRQEGWAFAYNTGKVSNPNLPEAELRRMADVQIAQREAKGQLTAEIAQRTAEYRAGAQDSTGTPYLLHPDSYLYLRYAREITERGTYGEQVPEIRERVDTLRSASAAITTGERISYGETIDWNPFPYSLVALYRLLRVFVPDIPLAEAAALYPILFGALLLILVYAVLRHMAGTAAAQFGTLSLAIHPQFFAAFQWGYVDTNAFNILSGAALISLCYAAVQCQNWVRRGFALAAAALLFLIFREVWIGALAFLTLALAMLIIMIGLRGLRHPHLRRHRATVLVVMVLLLLGIGSALRIHPLWRTLMWYLSGGDGGGAIPSAIPFIGEFRPLGALPWVAAVGGWVVIILLALGLWQMVQWLRGTRQDAAITLLLWAGALAYPSTRLRILQFAIVPMAMLVGIGAARCAEEGGKLLRQRGKINWERSATCGVMAMLLMLSLLPRTQTAIAIANSEMSDTIARVAERIAADTPPGAVIATWWNDGYLYQYFAQRGTYFDGASFDDSMIAYWLSRYFLETDRQIARNILRALSCNEQGLLQAMSALPSNTTETLNALLQIERSRAREFLGQQYGGEFFIEPQWQDASPLEIISGNLYCDHQLPTSVVLSESFLPLFSIFDWYAKVDFDHPEKPISGRSELNSIAVSCNTIGKQIICEEGISADIDSGKAKDPFGRTMPFFLYDGKQLYRPQEDVPPNRPIVIFYVDGDRLRAALVNSDLLNTMFVKLFFFGGEGMPEYEKIAEASGKYQPRVVAYRVDWNVSLTAP